MGKLWETLEHWQYRLEQDPSLWLVVVPAGIPACRYRKGRGAAFEQPAGYRIWRDFLF